MSTPRQLSAEAGSVPTPQPMPVPAPLARRLGRLALASLHAELALAPKPGLVTPFDRGSHDDMDAATFMRSLFALRGYYVAIAAAALADAPFDRLRQLGQQAEREMLRATAGVNTHRGAIFNLGVLVAQAARLRAGDGRKVAAETVCAGLCEWRAALLEAPLDAGSHGQRVRRRHRVAGAREQAASGYPLLTGVALPTLRAALATAQSPSAALAQTLMALIAELDDLNLLHRGGASGLRLAQRLARNFLREGGTTRADWRVRLTRIGEVFVAHRLSPGGSADLLACTWFLHLQERL